MRARFECGSMGTAVGTAMGTAMGTGHGYGHGHRLRAASTRPPCIPALAHAGMSRASMHSGYSHHGAT